MTPFFSLDVETTGTIPEKHSIIQLSAEYHVNGEDVKVFNTNLQPNPDKLIDLGALKYNGQTINVITSTMISSQKEGLIKFVDWALGLNMSKDTFILGTNVDFDINFIRKYPVHTHFLFEEKEKTPGNLRTSCQGLKDQRFPKS